MQVPDSWWNRVKDRTLSQRATFPEQEDTTFTKAALALAGFIPEFSAEAYASLDVQLEAFGSGLEITLLAAIPAGSGLGTSSILAATVLGAISDFCGLAWDKNEIGNRTLILEQLLTTGGGWQDQYGGVLHGLKLLQTNEGFNQNPLVRWLPEYLFTDPEYRPCHLLYYTGITRTAKDILSEIVRGMFLNSEAHLGILSEMKAHALDMYEAIQCGDFVTYGKLVGKTWEQNKALDSGKNPAAVEAIISKIQATPSWLFYCLTAFFPLFGFFYWLTDVKGNTSRFDIIKPAGTATLTCYILPYIWYSVQQLAGWTYPEVLGSGVPGLLKSLVFSIVIVQLTGLLVKGKIKLKV